MPFVRQKMRKDKKTGKTNGPYLEVVESIRQGDKVKQVFVQYLGSDAGVVRVTHNKKGEKLENPFFVVHGSSIPPKAKLTYVSSSPDVEVLARFRNPPPPDGNGAMRKVYHPVLHTQVMSEKKFARVAEVEKKRVVINKGIKSKMGDKNDKVRQNAEALYLIDNTSMRIGGTKDLGKERSYAVATLEVRHIKVNKKKGTVTIEYTGKKGVKQAREIKDQQLKNILIQRRQDAVKRAGGKKERTQQIFPNVTEGSALKLLRDVSPIKNTKVHDIRTAYATRMATSMCVKRSKRNKPKTKKEAAKLKDEIATAVAEQLGNTKGATLNSYINPLVWNLIGA